MALISICLSSCSSSNLKLDIESLALEYYQVYQQRNDFEKFLSFYDENIVLEDIINGDRIVGKQSFARFFDWNNPAYTRKNPKALIVEELMVDGYQTTAKGYFTGFQWQGSSFEAMQFTTLITFNKEGLIIKQVDWVNYPNNLVDYSKRKNSNLWIKISN